MSEKVIISCIPKLNEVQQQGMLQLLGDIETLGYKAYLWTDHDYAQPLAQFKLNAVIPKPANRWVAKIKKLLLPGLKPINLDQDKWTQRLMRWLDISDMARANKTFNIYLQTARHVFATYKPGCFFCWNPFCCQFGIAYDVAKALSIKTAAIEWGYLPHTFLLDAGGTLAKSSIFNKDILKNYTAQQLARFYESGEQIFEQLQAQSLSLYHQAKVDIPADCLVQDVERSKLLVLAIDEIDAGAYPPQHHERLGLLPFHASSIDQAKAIAAVNPNYRVIFKPHPSHNLYAHNHQISANCWVVNGNPDQLIDWADVVFCSGSKMEFSALLKSKPLITYGAGLLYGKGCSYELQQPEDIAETINAALQNTGAENRLRRFKEFLGYLKEVYLYQFNEQGSSSGQSILKSIIK